MFDQMNKKITDLEGQVRSNEAAANILSEMIIKKEVVQEPDGRISIAKK